MPSSIKNRFTNSYEPVFVFSKTKNNNYQKLAKKRDNKNVFKIPLQPTSFKHIATYPERLVLDLINTVDPADGSTILDPFAGSGTTLKVIKENFPKCSAVMIEYNENYINVIKDRCNLSKSLEATKLKFISYYSKKINFENKDNFSSDPYDINQSINLSEGFVSIVDNKKEFYKILNNFMNQNLKKKINKKSTFFIGCKEFDNDLIYHTSLLNKNGWIIRNMIVIEENNRWFPVFMIVDDNKSTDYIFNYKILNLKSKGEFQRNWHESQFVGIKVVNSTNKIKREGKIVSVLEKLNNGFPKYVVVQWSEGDFTREYVVYSQEQVNKNIKLKISDSKISIEELETVIDLDKNFNYIKNNKDENKTTLFDLPPDEEYNGKFKGEKRINFGASPGARASVDAEYFSLQRLYEVDQNLIVDYLNEKRILKGYTKKKITDLFPPEYKHTVGHWLRKDFGGSLPTPEDWDKLRKILDIDNDVTNYLCKTALRIQTVKHAEFKMPDDFQQIEFNEKFELLINE